jgi:hypothetical protein
LELGQQGAAVARAHAGGLGQPGAGDGLAGGDHRGVGGAGAFALAARIAVCLAGRVEFVDGGLALGELDLDTLAAELLSVVDQTMQPTAVSLWLRPSVASSPSPDRAS